jgi:hypothetical protein
LTRKIPSLFREARHIAAILYASSIVALISIPLIYQGSAPELDFVLRSLAPALIALVCFASSRPSVCSFGVEPFLLFSSPCSAPLSSLFQACVSFLFIPKLRVVWKEGRVSKSSAKSPRHGTQTRQHTGLQNTETGSIGSSNKSTSDHEEQSDEHRPNVANESKRHICSASGRSLSR